MIRITRPRVFPRFLPAATCVVVASFAAPAVAQGTISNAQVSYSVGAISASQSDSISAAFSGNPVVDDNVLFEHWYYYRIDNDTAERAFRNDGTLSQSYVGSHADLDWSNLDGRNRLRAELDLDVVSTGSNSGNMVARMTFTNISANAITLDFFAYVDLDVCSFAGNSAVGSGTRQVVNGNPCVNEQVAFEGVGADNWCVTDFDATECGITNAGIIDLPNTGLPFNGDFVGAVQWRDRVLQPGESATFVSSLEHNPGACATRAASANYGSGLAGARGLPTISTTALPVLGNTGTVAVGNALPLTTGLLTIGFVRANVPVGNLTLLLNPVVFQNLTVDATGAGQASFPIPFDQAFCGGNIQFQFFFVDSAVVGQFPVAHTDGLEWTAGS